MSGRVQQGVSPPILAEAPVCSPLRSSWQAWRVALQNHPDKRFAEFILRGIQEGFRVGYAGQVVAVKSVVHNCPSAVEHKEVIDKGNVS